MKFALVDGNRHEAKPGLKGACQACGLPMTSKCGQQRVHHWAHQIANCDPWWERETQWHRDWKNEFPQDCQEVRYAGTDGEVHIADVRTPSGTVLEFQHSHLPFHERRSREAFYGNMAWIVDGSKNGKDLGRFADLLAANIQDYGDVKGWRLPLRRFGLVDDWVSSPCPVYLDFGHAAFPNQGLPAIALVWRIAKAPSGRIVVTPFPRQSVVDHYTRSTPLEGFEPHPRPPYWARDYRTMD